MDVADGGWPSASVESLWAIDLGDGTVQLDNTPWFVRGVASDDIIRVEDRRRRPLGRGGGRPSGRRRARVRNCRWVA
ncbi:DUF4265 domain-containing protein [Streptomyces sp. NBC_01003]|uniref:DUF4265 domain-containing protein n=1 Tax=Streptomyces sp. NBC_01003 TaxID=2903714 RepID=UPI0038647138|nr:DUF4265 domain-containing protein [Streptomyces sp. NBC_01003]